MNLFETYEQDYSNISTSITKKINVNLIHQSGGISSTLLTKDTRKATVRAIERELDEADEILQSMELELNSLPPSTRTRLQPRLRSYRQDYEKLRNDLKNAALKSERDELLGGYDSSEPMSTDQRARLLAGTEKLNEASKRLEDSHRLALETEDIGANTLQTLRNQRQQILRATDTVSC